MLKVTYLVPKGEDLKDVRDIINEFLMNYTQKTFRLEVDGLKLMLYIGSIETWLSCQKIVATLNFILEENGYLDFIVELEIK